MLRGGSDTAAARHAKEVLLAEPKSRWVATIASRMWAEPSERQRGIEWAARTASAAIPAARRLGIRTLTYLEPGYPERLREIPDPPVVLWFRGDAACLNTDCVAVVGSREATPMSLLIAKTLGRQLADAGLCVVSGLARGVDGAAHVGALEGGGPTIGVLGSGVDRIYPERHGALSEQIVGQGALISELPPGSRPLPRHFPLRNRIISGLSRATVVIEAGEKSGSLITARLAIDQNRDVLAVPGGTLGGRHSGCHHLIKQGARLVESVKDVLDELNWRSPRPAASEKAPNHLQLSDLEANMAMGETYSVDDLVRRTGESASEILTKLSVLELSGHLIRTDGGRFMRLVDSEATQGN